MNKPPNEPQQNERRLALELQREQQMLDQLQLMDQQMNALRQLTPLSEQCDQLQQQLMELPLRRERQELEQQLREQGLARELELVSGMQLRELLLLQQLMEGPQRELCELEWERELELEQELEQVQERLHQQLLLMDRQQSDTQLREQLGESQIHSSALAQPESNSSLNTDSADIPLIDKEEEAEETTDFLDVHQPNSQDRDKDGDAGGNTMNKPPSEPQQHPKNPQTETPQQKESRLALEQQQRGELQLLVDQQLRELQLLVDQQQQLTLQQERAQHMQQLREQREYVEQQMEHLEQQQLLLLRQELREQLQPAQLERLLEQQREQWLQKREDERKQEEQLGEQRELLREKWDQEFLLEQPRRLLQPEHREQLDQLNERHLEQRLAQGMEHWVEERMEQLLLEQEQLGESQIHSSALAQSESNSSLNTDSTDIPLIDKEEEEEETTDFLDVHQPNSQDRDKDGGGGGNADGAGDSNDGSTGGSTGGSDGNDGSTGDLNDDHQHEAGTHAENNDSGASLLNVSNIFNYLIFNSAADSAEKYNAELYINPLATILMSSGFDGYSNDHSQNYNAEISHELIPSIIGSMNQHSAFAA